MAKAPGAARNSGRGAQEPATGTVSERLAAAVEERAARIGSLEEQADRAIGRRLTFIRRQIEDEKERLRQDKAYARTLRNQTGGR